MVLMRRAERPLSEQPNAVTQLPCNRVDGGCLDRLVERQRRQNAGEPPRQHGLARAGRSDHEQVVTAGRSDFQCAASERLTVEVS